MKAEHVLEGLKALAEQLGIHVRTERGNFRGGHCLVSGEEVIVLNRHHIPEIQIAILAEGLRGVDVDQVYVKPALRRALEENWTRSETQSAKIDSDDE